MQLSEETAMWLGVILSVLAAISLFVGLVVLYFVLGAIRNRHRRR
jgi:uncharacterized membrane protein